jgi:carboxypeptidase Taq
MSLDALLDHLRQTAALAQVAGILSWDQEAMMPPAGAGQRAEQASALAAVIHARRADPRITDWAGAIDRAALPAFDRRNVEEALRAHARATRVPERLARALAHAAAEGHRIWAAAREARDFAAFRPALERIVALKREEAACLADGGDPYDALLDAFEPGATVAELAPLLEGLRPRLVALREALDARPATPPLTGQFPKDAQLALARRVAGRLGYDFGAGRIDTVVHPFCAGAGLDVRITTRVDEADPFNCLYSTIHETGHALYAQGTPDPFLPAAEACSMGVHESQSRFWENQIARSRSFAEWLWPEMRAAFGDAAPESPEALHRVANRVHRGFIRTEADEVHYNLHILMRFELEREMIAGTLAPADLEEAWNARFERDFGLAVPHAALGVLQDVHWAAGLFGYFPTYSLGNIYAACLDRAMRRDLPERDRMVREGAFGEILGWLRMRIHEKGRLLPAPELIAEAAGEPPSPGPLLDYLEAKFAAADGA